MPRNLICVLCTALLMYNTHGAFYGLKPDGPPRTGRYHDTLKEPQDESKIIEFWVRVPAGLPKRDHLALIVSFYGAGGGQNPNYESGNPPHYMHKLGLTNQYVFLSPRSKGNGWGKADEAPVGKLIEWVMSAYPIDPRRVYLYGFSSGGFFAGPYALSHKETIAGAILVAGNVKGLKKMRDAAEKGQEFYLICGTNDSHNGASIKSRDSLRDTGYRYIYRAVSGYNHNNIQSHDPSLTDAFKWLHALRHKDKAPSEEDRALLARFEAAKHLDGLWGGKDTAAALTRIGGAEAGKAVLAALEAGNEKVRTEAAGLCTRVMFGREVVKQLALRFEKAESDALRKTVFEPLAACANWRFEDAQMALARTAANRKLDADHRLLAIDGIKKAVELPMLGNFEDRILFEALTTYCLADKEQRIRRAAIGILSEAVENGYGYDPTLEPRKRKNLLALQQWQQWLNTNCGKPKPRRR